MSLLAAIFDWEDPAPPVEQIGQLLSALPDRTPDGRRFARASHALLGFGARVVRKAERTALQPFRDDRSALYAIGDLRLDNRDELKVSVSDGHRALDSDLAIVVAAYERWGHQMAERLIGDFAFVIWDGRRREVYAARDPFGVRSLVYHRSVGRLLLATDPAQLIALKEVDRSPNPQVVVDFLSWSYAHYGPTFFRSIHAIRSGHYLLANAESVREVEYFRPLDRLIRYTRADDYREEFRSLFKRAVKDRIDSEYPVVAHLSGGLDSSSIVCLADRIYDDGDGGRPPFHVVSAVFPSQSYDESPFIDEVVRNVRFQAHKWDGNQPSRREFSHPSVSSPGSSVAFNGGSAGDIETAERLGARVILSGDPGDTVTAENGLFNDLLIRGSWVTLARQIASGGSSKERHIRLKLLRYAIREEAPPPLLQIWRAVNLRRQRTHAADWLRPHLREMWTGFESRSPPFLKLGSNRLQQRIWDYLRWSRTAWSVDLMGIYAASAGAEVRFPLLDTRLIRFVLAVPVEYRLLGGLRRSLHREAMVGIVPEGIARRSSKPGFSGALVQWGHACLPTIREILEGPQWHADPFVDRLPVRVALRKLASRPPDRADGEAWLNVRSIVHLETWLRALFRYPRMQETLPMSEIRETGEEEQVGDAGATSHSSYDPPMLTQLRPFSETRMIEA